MSPSSIFSFETLALSARDVARGIGLLALSVLWVALISHGVERAGVVDTYDGWGQFQLKQVRERASAYAQAHGGIDVMLFGNSVLRSVNPERIERAWAARRLSAFNASIGASRPNGQIFILKETIFPIVKPKLLIYEVGPRDLNDAKRIARGRQPVYRTRRGRAYLARTPMDRFVAALERELYLFGARRELRRYLLHGYENRDERPADARGMSVARRARLVRQLKGKPALPKKYRYRKDYARYQVDRDGTWKDVVTVIETSRAHGVDVVLVNMPIAPACFSLFDQPERDYAMYMAALRRVVDATGVPFYDAHDELDLQNIDFADAHHPARTGSDAFADYLNDFVLRDYFKQRK